MWQHDHSCIVLVLLKEIIALKNLWNALHYDATIVFARDSESQLFESQEGPGYMQLHKAHWILLKIIAELNQSISSGATKHQGRDEKIMTMHRVSDSAIYCNTISALWFSVWANKYVGQSMWEKYPPKNQCFLQTRIIIINIPYSWKTLVIQTNLMVVNKELWFYVHINSSIQVIITGIKGKAPKPTNKCDYY